MIESRLLTRQIEKAQRKVEAHNFDMRKHLLEYDDVANEQRKVIYQQRTELMAAEDVKEAVREIRGEVVALLVEQFVPAKSLPEQWDLDGLAGAVERDFAVRLDLKCGAESFNDESEVRKRVVAAIEQDYEPQGRERRRTGDACDRKADHAAAARPALARAPRGDGLPAAGHRLALARGPQARAGVQARSLRSLLQHARPHQARNAFAAVAHPGPQPGRRSIARKRSAAGASHAPCSCSTPRRRPRGCGSETPTGAGRRSRAWAQLASAPYVRGDRKVGRNEPCPCGSGRKYKHCHGTLA